MSDDNEKEVTSAGATDVFQALGRVVGNGIGMIVTLVVGLMLAVGSGLAIGRAVDLLQGAVPRPLQDMTAALDGWSVLFAAYILLWLPVGALIRVWRPDGLGDGDDP
jgi:hypothetical protein